MVHLPWFSSHRWTFPFSKVPMLILKAGRTLDCMMSVPSFVCNAKNLGESPEIMNNNFRRTMNNNFRRTKNNHFRRTVSRERGLILAESDASHLTRPHIWAPTFNICTQKRPHGAFWSQCMLKKWRNWWYWCCLTRIRPRTAGSHHSKDYC